MKENNQTSEFTSYWRTLIPPENNPFGLLCIYPICVFLSALQDFKCENTRILEQWLLYGLKQYNAKEAA